MIGTVMRNVENSCNTHSPQGDQIGGIFGTPEDKMGKDLHGGTKRIAIVLMQWSR